MPTFPWLLYSAVSCGPCFRINLTPGLRGVKGRMCRFARMSVAGQQPLQRVGTGIPTSTKLIGCFQTAILTVSKTWVSKKCSNKTPQYLSNPIFVYPPALSLSPSRSFSVFPCFCFSFSSSSSFFVSFSCYSALSPSLPLSLFPAARPECVVFVAPTTRNQSSLKVESAVGCILQNQTVGEPVASRWLSKISSFCQSPPQFLPSST